jgi:Tfp pilus assembly protein PilF
MSASWKHVILGAALATGLLAGSPPARCADEALQAQLLKQLFRTTEPDWLGILRENSGLLDQTFFERVDARIRWSAENNQIDDAIRFSLVGDLACDALGRQGGYRLGLVYAFQKAGNDDIARQLVDNILLTTPNAHNARYIRATYMRADGDFVGADEEYRKLISAGHRVADCYAGLGMIATVMDKLQDAKQHFKAALAADPNHPIAGPSLAKIEAMTVANGAPFGDVPVTASATSQPPQVDPKMFALYLRQAENATKTNKLREAEINYQKAITANPKDGVPRIYLGALYYRMGNVAGALANINAGLGLAPQNAEGWRYAGCAFERRFDATHAADDLNNAKKAFRRTLELQPNDPIAQMGLERLNGKASKAAGSAPRPQ